jgi:hypothetical protein
MTAKAIFSNTEIKCRVKITHDNGEIQKEDFDRVSDLVVFLNRHHIEIPLNDCITVDHLDTEK